MKFFYFKIQTGAKVLTNKSPDRAKCERECKYMLYVNVMAFDCDSNSLRLFTVGLFQNVHHLTLCMNYLWFAIKLEEK